MSEDRTTATNAVRGRQPVTWHPLFPAAVAVWFGALFGLGTLAVRVSLIERIVVASGIQQVIHAATPPLGVNARILIALALAMLGGVIGLMIGRFLARSQPAACARRAAAAEAAAELAEAAPAKAAAFDDAPSFIDFSKLDIDDAHRIEADVEHATAESVTEPEPEREFRRPLDPVTFPLPASFPVPGGAAAQRLNAADLDSLSHLELIERLALSLQKRREELADEVSGQPAYAGDSEPHDDQAVATSPALPAAASQILNAPSYYPPAPDSSARRFAPVQPDGHNDSRPVALFPDADGAPAAALRHDSAGTDRALREALAALQRMSGAA